MPTSRIRALTLISISATFSACISTKEQVLPHDGPTMQQIYESHFNGMQSASPNTARTEISTRPAIESEADLAAFTRDATNELDVHFPRLPNPTLVMYVFPHLAGVHHLPVPGYSTTFPLYAHTEYALPGEVPVHPTPAHAVETPP